ACPKPLRVGDLKELALCWAGAERRHLHAEARHLRSETQREETIKRLGRRIGGDVRDGLKARRRRNNQHPSAPALDPAWYEKPREPHHGLAVDPYLAQLLLFS